MATNYNDLANHMLNEDEEPTPVPQPAQTSQTSQTSATFSTTNRIQVDTTQVSQKAAGGGRVRVDTTQSLIEGVDHRVTKELKIEKKD